MGQLAQRLRVALYAIEPLSIKVLRQVAESFTVQLVGHAARADHNHLKVLGIGGYGPGDGLAEAETAACCGQGMLDDVNDDRDGSNAPVRVMREQQGERRHQTMVDLHLLTYR